MKSEATAPPWSIVWDTETFLVELMGAGYASLTLSYYNYCPDAGYKMNGSSFVDFYTGTDDLLILPELTVEWMCAA